MIKRQLKSLAGLGELIHSVIFYLPSTCDSIERAEKRYIDINIVRWVKRKRKSIREVCKRVCEMVPANTLIPNSSTIKMSPAESIREIKLFLS